MNRTSADFYVLSFLPSEIMRNSDHHFSGIHVPENIARGIASSPLWSVFSPSGGSILVVRNNPPLLAVFGSFDNPDRARLDALVRQMNFALRRLRYVSYDQAERDCRLLASKLREKFDEKELKKFSYTAIPRGGMIVLGMLSYLLGLEPWQMGTPETADIPLVVVDDCALSGHRLSAAMRTWKNRHIIFAPLYSPPELRTAIERRESRVIGCISARDLVDYSQDNGEVKQTFDKTWQERLGDDRYWMGLPEYICFPWNEPDRLFWNPVLEKVESGWKILPPELCMKNGVPRIPIFIQPQAEGRLRAPDHIIYAIDGNAVIIGDLERKKTYSLEGTAADIWEAVIEFGNEDLAVRAFMDRYEIADAPLREEVTCFIENLVKDRILERAQ